MACAGKSLKDEPAGSTASAGQGGGGASNADNLGICNVPSEPTSACTGFAAGCAVTAAELDRCVVDQERWLDAVPSCENFTYDTAQSGPGPEP